MTIVTKTGDRGETGLFGGRRVSKGDTRLHAYGSVDELNAVVGIVIAELESASDLKDELVHIQHLLFRLGADLATPREGNANVPRTEAEHIQLLEDWIHGMESSMTMPAFFVLPGGTKAASQLHLARTVCRRAERWAVACGHMQDIGPFVVMFLNRLSDYLFLAALKANADAAVENVRVRYE